MTTASVLSKSFAIVREDLHRLYGAACDAATIDSILDDVIAELSSSAKVTNFLPVLAEREATERIKATSGCKDFAPRQEILFADSRGSGRSQIATALAYHLVGDEVFIRTIGLTPEDGLNPRVVEALHDRGVDTSRLTQKTITPRVSHRADVVVLMGIEETPAVPGDRYVEWGVADPDNLADDELQSLIDDIETRLRALFTEMDVAVA
ncbi:protein tyrosine phosphatase [Corynebacterium amycolatum]|uniref:arsenate-mycothiol transferase ArsC n=1 Tax=Corynebacterium TaxID=1716 RepID=UPI0012B8BF4A|nr:MULTISPECIES: protein tyrosine phosphatase [Corynebacterium]KAA9269683.1 protein tyrosine phosphatase [Corynebacterium amycolatum]MBC6757814.1 protein tyrosine phosphatase [Corynebacterium sp. LK24]MBU5623553.1 protein tyrosine phosphatase [Corynebacterium amycolatum]